MAGLVLLDYIVFVATLAISLSIGLYHAFFGAKQNTMQQYVLGNRKMAVIPVALSLTISFQSSIMLLGTPAEIYEYGIPYMWSAFGLVFSNMFALISVVPLIHPLQITSFYEYFQIRFQSRLPRIVATVMAILNNVFYMGIVLYGPGIAIEAVTDFPMWVSVLVVAVSAIIYTAVGGLRAVVWTDVFQFSIMVIGIFSIIIKTTIDVGGVQSVFHIAYTGKRLEWPSFSLDPTIRNTYWSLMVGSTLSLTYLLTTQTTSQRICSLPTQQDAKKMIITSAVTTVINFLLSCLLGIMAYAYFQHARCDPLVSKKIANSNQVLPFLVVSLFQDIPGMAGVFVASMASASLSTISSILSSLSAQTIEDIVKPLSKDISDAKATVIAKISVFVYGVIGIGISFLIANIKGPLSQITYSLLSSFAGSVAGMFFFAAYCPWANGKGTVVGGFSGMSLVLFIALGQSFSTTLMKSTPLPPAASDMCWDENVAANTSSYLSNTVELTGLLPNGTYLDPSIADNGFAQNYGLDVLYSISYFWMTPLCLVTTMVVGTIVSFLTGRPKPSEIDVRYMLPFFDYCCPFLPKRVRKILYCGADFTKREEMLGSLDYEEDNKTHLRRAGTGEMTKFI